MRLNIRKKAKQAIIKSVADIGGGRHWHAQDDDALRTAYIEIANDLIIGLTGKKIVDIYMTDIKFIKT